MEVILEKAIQLRKDNKPEEALSLLKELDLNYPKNPEVNYQIAWTCDFMGKEKEAVPYYKNAIEFGLKGDELKGAYLRLGSTLRCPGEYKDSLNVFNEALTKFPNERPLKVFKALTLYNLEDYQSSIHELLTQLLDTTSDENIKVYEKALRFYSDKLNDTWRD